VGSKNVTKDSETEDSNPKGDAARHDGRPRSTVRQDMHTVSEKANKPANRGAAGTDSRDRSVDWLGRSLRQLYDGTAREPIPDKFRALLDQLDERDKATDGKAPEKDSKE